MNDEIKEIKHTLELLHAECNPKAREEDINNVLNYINNLRQENAYFNKKNIELSTLNTSLRSDRDDYKSRCEKASEYIDKQKKKMYKSRNKIAMFILMKLENILQNGSENDE